MKLSPETVSLQALKNYRRARPDEQQRLMAMNQRYFFFPAVAAGPVGSLGVWLTEDHLFELFGQRSGEA